jgi:hypothetical protein
MSVQAAAQALEGLALAEWLRMSRWGYAAVSALHVFGIALLVGGIVPLDLRLLGLWRSMDLAGLYRVLARVAATGLALAAVSGFLMFSARAAEYAALDLFALKLALIGGGTTHALLLHLGSQFPAVSRPRQITTGVISLLVWPVTLVCGRLLAFV